MSKQDVKVRRADTSSIIRAGWSLPIVQFFCFFYFFWGVSLACRLNPKRFFWQAESFRSAALQYRILSTRLEERIRLHRHVLNEIYAERTPNGGEERRADSVVKEQGEFVAFFDTAYKRIVEIQSEMKYFPPKARVKEWIAQGRLRPNPVDQPMAKVKSRAQALTTQERERALYLLTNAEVPFAEFRAHPDVRTALASYSKKNN